VSAPLLDVTTWAVDQAQLSLTRWVVTSAVWCLGQLVGLLGDGMTPNLDGRWYRELYGLMVTMAATLAPLFLLLAALQALVRQDVQVLGRAVVNLAVAFVAAALAVPLVGLLLQLSDNLSDYLVTAELASLNRFLGQVSLSLGQDLGGSGISGATAAPLFLVLCSGTVVCFGCVLIWIELLVREVATYVAVLFFPLLLAVAVWCFARSYYFAFYVIERYVDPGYRFAGLGSFVRYLLRRRQPAPPPGAGPDAGPTSSLR